MKKFWQSKILWNNLLGLAALAIQSQTSYLAPVEAQAALLAVSNMVLRTWFSGQAIDMSQVKAGFDKLLLGKRGLPVLLLIGLALSGCSTLKVIDEQPVLSEFAVRVAVGRFLDEHPQWARSTQEISASAIRLVNEGDEVALPELARYIKTQIPWDNLTWEEELQIDLLIDVISSEIVSALPPLDVGKTQEIRVRAATVLGWIHQVAEIYTLRRSAAINWQDAGPLAGAAIEQAAAAADRKYGL